MNTQENCQTESGPLGRREFLSAASVSAAALSLPSIARAQSVSPGGPHAPPTSSLAAPNHTLVYVYLRGGPDGLSFLAPTGDADYSLYRQNLAIQNGIPLASPHFTSPYWVLSSALQPLMSAYSQGDLALLPATGQLENNKSHFVAMDRMELGAPPTTPPNAQPNPGPITTGFMARHLSSVNFATTAPLRGMVSQKLTTTSFLGAPKSLAVSNPSTYSFPGDDFMRAGLTGMNATQSQLLKDANNNAFAAIDYLSGISFSDGINGYPLAGGMISTLGRKFRDAEEIIKSGLAPEVIEIDFGGWDTHNLQGPNLGGGMYARMQQLAQAMANFYARLRNFTVPGTGQTGMQRCTVIALGEFGRRVQENSTNGTDHGNGGLVMAMGARVNGRIYDDDYHARWQTARLTDPNITPLTASQDDQGDVDSLTDYRDVFAEAFTKMMGLVDESLVYFPGYALPSISRNIFT